MKKVVLAFSGGLDTSFCVSYLCQQGYAVHTLTVNSGGFDQDQLSAIEALALRLGAVEHHSIDARKSVYDQVVGFLIKGNIQRGSNYPLCVAAERFVQAQCLVERAHQLGATTVAHGCTASGNDQVRFEIEIRACDSQIEIVAPVRDQRLSREAIQEYLLKNGFAVDGAKKKYSINKGIVGTTIGGGETHNSWEPLHEDGYATTCNPESVSQVNQEIIIDFTAGLPSALNQESSEGYELLTSLNRLAGSFGIGRGMHIGDTVMGIKGRIAFEAPAMQVLIAAHRELEKIVLTKWQSFVKDQAAQIYGMLLHEGQWSNPALRDIEALFDSSQRKVTGQVRIALRPGRFSIEGCRSPYSLMDARASYGEKSELWSAADAAGYSKIFGLQTVLAAQREVG